MVQIPAIFGKLNLKDQNEIFVLNAPSSFQPMLRQLAGVDVRTTLSGVQRVSFALAFVTRQAEVDSLAKALAQRAQGDALIWFAYPKGTSKRYTCDFNRDSGWAVLGKAGFETVRAVAIDEDWSALRFRRTEFVKKMARRPEHAISAKGRARVAGKNS